MDITIPLKPNQVAILDYNTREVTFVDLDRDPSTIEDMETHLDELGYDTSNILYMS